MAVVCAVIQAWFLEFSYTSKFAQNMSSWWLLMTWCQIGIRTYISNHLLTTDALMPNRHQGICNHHADNR